MEFSAQQIATYLQGTVDGNPDATVKTFAKIEEGVEGAISFLANPKYAHYLYETKSSVVLVNNDFTPEKEYTATLVRVPNAYEAIAKLLTLYEQFKGKRSGIHPLAFVAESAKVAEDCYVGPFAYVGDNAEVGAGTQLYPHAVVEERAKVGENCILYPNVSVYHDCIVGNRVILHSGCVIGADGFGFAPSPNGYEKIPQIGNVSLGDNVEIGANTCIDCATMGSTRINDGVKLDNLIQIAHNVELGKNTAIAAQTGVSGSTKIGSNCVIAGQVGFVGHIHIADGTKIGAQSGILGNVKKNGEEIMGSPAMPLKDYLRMSVYTKNIEKLVKRVETLEKQLKEKQQ